MNIGDVLNETFRIEELIASGGTGEVYRATNEAQNTVVAIKILHARFSQNPDFIELLRREVDRNIRSDAVVRYHQLLRTEQLGGLHYIVMEYIPGPSLAEWMAARGPIDADTLLTIAARAAAGLEAAHAQRVFHRDVAPDNIILRGGDPAAATLIDFGIAKELDTQRGTLIGHAFAGKYEYAPPEQLDGRVDERTDVYALGATLLAAARGREPQMPSGLADLVALKRAPVDVSDQPEPLRTLLAGMLAPDPADRIPSAAELRRRIEAARRGEIAAARPEAPRFAAPELSGAPGPAPAQAGPGARPPAPARRRGRGGLIAAVLALVVLGAGAAWWLMQPRLPDAAVWRLRAWVSAEGSGFSGNAPGEEAAAALLAAARAAGIDAASPADLALAGNEPFPEWDEQAAALLGATRGLLDWRLDVSGAGAVLRGTAADEAAASQAERAAQAAAAAGPMTVDAAIEVDAPAPTAEEVMARLQAAGREIGGCGPLAIEASGAAMTVRGAVADAAALDRTVAALQAEAPPPAGLTFELEVLNAPVCAVLAALPRPLDPSLRFEIHDLEGRPLDVERIPGDRTPVVEAILPADARGRLYGFLVDHEGAVIHLLPSVMRPENRVEAEGAPGPDGLRVPISFDDAGEDFDAGRFVLRLEPPYGKAIVVLILADDILYEQEREFEQHVDRFAPELARALDAARRKGERVRANVSPMYLVEPDG